MNIIAHDGGDPNPGTGSLDAIPNDQIKLALDRLCLVFCETAMETVRVLLQKKCVVHLPWEVVEQLQGQFDRILTMGSSSSSYSAITCIGVQKDSLDALLGAESTAIEEAADILGEIANTYCGMLADNPAFCGAFGPLTQAVPALYLDGNSFLPFIWGVQGYLYFGDHWVYFGYSIRNNISSQRP